VSDITAFETLVASESEHKIAQQAAADKLAAAIYDVREQYGAHLLCAKTKDEFNDRLALCKDDMMKTVNAHLMPVTGVMRKVCKTMEREWRERTAADAVNPTSPGAPMNDMGLADGMAQAQTGTGAYGPGIPDDSMGGGIQGPGMTNTGQPFVASRDLFAYTPEELDAYGQQSNDQEAPHPKATHAADPHGEWTGASGGKEGRRRRADTTHPVQDIDPTYHPSDGPLIPEGDFHGYLDSVSQNGYDNPHTPNNDFTPGGDSGKQARRRQSNEMMGYPAQPGGGGMPDASGTATPGTAAPAMTPAPPGTAGSSPEMVTAAIIKRYAQWCVANLARPSVKTLEYYAANRSDLDYFVLTAALQRRADSYTNTNYPVDEGDPVIPGSGSNPGLGGPLGGAVHPYNDADFAPKQGSRHTAGSKDYLQQADEAITKLLNEKAEEFQESITPLQQALQTIQYAQQVQQAQQPMNVMPPAGTVNVLPQGQDPQAPPQGMDPAALAGMVSAGQGGGDPTQQDGQDGPPPAAADQGAIPPDMAQQIQAYRRRIARATSSGLTTKSMRTASLPTPVTLSGNAKAVTPRFGVIAARVTRRATGATPSTTLSGSGCVMTGKTTSRTTTTTWATWRATSVRSMTLAAVTTHPMMTTVPVAVPVVTGSVGSGWLTTTPNTTTTPKVLLSASMVETTVAGVCRRSIRVGGRGADDMPELHALTWSIRSCNTRAKVWLPTRKPISSKSY
jgi:hypothetical protein